jgi:hypothetical protein
LTTVVYIGGPRHGEVEAIPVEPLAAPSELRFPTFHNGEIGEAVYRRQEQADTPGRIAYVYTGEDKA